MPYDLFVSAALKSYASMPYEVNELYKRQGIGFDLHAYEEELKLGNATGTHVAAYAAEAASKLKTKFDAVVGDGELLHNNVTGLRLAPMIEAYEDVSEASMHRNEEDKFVAFSNAFARNALILDVKEGSVVALNIVFAHDATTPPLQFFIRGAEGSNISINELFVSDDGSIMSGIVQEIALGRNAAAEVNVLHLEGAGTRTFGLTKASAGDSATLVLNNLYSGSGVGRYRTGLLSKGRGASIESNDVILGSGEQKFDLYTNTINDGEGSKCAVETKAVALDSSSIIVKGMAKIMHGSKKSASYLKERGILYDKGTQIRMMPDMSIDESDVKATHSSSVSPIDEESLFYLGARGLHHEDAKRIIVDGFMLGTLEKIGNSHGRVLATAMAIGKLRDRAIGLREIDAKDAWASTNGMVAHGPMFADSYKYRYAGGANEN